MVDRDPVRRNAAVSANVTLHGQTRRTTASIRDDSSSEMATVRTFFLRAKGVGGAGDALFAMLLFIFSRVRVPRDF